MVSRRWVSLLGTLLVVISLLFVGHRFWLGLQEADDFLLSTKLLFRTGVGAVGYAAACLSLVLAWRRMLLISDRVFMTLPVAAAIYARSQIAKYLPGNVFHIAARHAYGRALGHSHGSLAIAAGGEMAGLLGVASLLGLLAASATGLAIDARWYVLAVVLTGFSIPLLFLAWPRLRDRLAPLHEVSRIRLLRAVLAVGGWYLLFFSIAGAVLILIAAGAVDGLTFRQASAAVLCFACAYVAGFLTPGAPSGLGVREAVIVLALEQLGLGAHAVLIALLFRVATVAGDVLFLVVLLPVKLDRLDAPVPPAAAESPGR